MLEFTLSLSSTSPFRENLGLACSLETEKLSLGCSLHQKTQFERKPEDQKTLRYQNFCYSADSDS